MIPASRNTRRGLLAAAAAIALSGCSTFNDPIYGQLGQYAEQVWSGEGKYVTLQQAAAVPYASIGVQFADGPQSIMVLATDSDGTQMWTSAEHIVLVTRGGRIVRTAGLPKNLGDLVPQGSAAQDNTAEHFIADFPELQIFAAPIDCTARAQRPALITILGKPIHTMRQDVDCQAPTMHWHFTDSYWLDPSSGLPWRSVQYVNPTLDPLTIEVLRPAG